MVWRVRGIAWGVWLRSRIRAERVIRGLGGGVFERFRSCWLLTRTRRIVPLAVGYMLAYIIIPNRTVVTSVFSLSPFSNLNISLTNFTLSSHISLNPINPSFSSKWMILSLFMGTFACILLEKFKLKDFLSLLLFSSNSN